jgi:hypothetical protein
VIARDARWETVSSRGIEDRVPGSWSSSGYSLLDEAKGFVMSSDVGRFEDGMGTGAKPMARGITGRGGGGIKRANGASISRGRT